MNALRLERASKFVLRIVVFVIAVSFFFRALSEVSSRGLDLFMDSVSAALAIGALATALYLHFRRQLPFGKLLCVLALPIGLLYTSVGLVGMALFVDDYAKVGPNAANLLLKALYGAVLSAVGHFWNDEEFTVNDNYISLVELCFL